jgi:hypothetical protein
MKYILLMYANPADAALNTPDDWKAEQTAWFTFMQEAKAAGVLVDNNGIAPGSNTTTVRVRSGKTLSTDGPFAETHEHLAGFSVIECKDLDEAIGWAAKVPSAKYGAIEVRPLWAPG